MCDAALNLMSLVSEMGFKAGTAEYAEICAGQVGKRRLQDCLWLVRHVESDALGAVVTWRRKANPAIANFFREGFLTCPAFGNLRGQKIKCDTETKCAQLIAVAMATSRLDSAELDESGGVIRVKAECKLFAYTLFNFI